MSSLPTSFRIILWWLKNLVSSCNSVKAKSENGKHRIAKQKKPNKVDNESEKKKKN